VRDGDKPGVTCAKDGLVGHDQDVVTTVKPAAVK
jgi:hypothetical protein